MQRNKIIYQAEVPNTDNPSTSPSLRVPTHTNNKLLTVITYYLFSYWMMIYECVPFVSKKWLQNEGYEIENRKNEIYCINLHIVTKFYILNIPLISKTCRYFSLFCYINRRPCMKYYWFSFFRDHKTSIRATGWFA